MSDIIKITNRVEEYFDTIEAILDDHLVEDGLRTELDAAEESLLKDIYAFDGEEPTFKKIIEQLKHIDSDDIDQKELMEFLDKDFINEEITRDGFFCVKVENLQQSQLLEEFVTTHIWPHYNQQDNIIM